MSLRGAEGGSSSLADAQGMNLSSRPSMTTLEALILACEIGNQVMDLLGILNDDDDNDDMIRIPTTMTEQGDRRKQ
jgi:hypothetical protein